MSSTNIDHGGSHDDSEIHLPDPSVWPLVAGFAAMLFGAALIWWSRDRSNDVAGPLLGGALLFLFLSAFGWGWQDAQMRRKAAQGDHGGARNPRFTQVLTFAIADGQVDAARSEAGVLSIIDRSDLRNFAGFQDLRITVSPAEVGPSQVLVETTWSGREELASYDTTRQSLLDTLAAHPEQVVAGSVQVFDMEVVRDTKDTSFKFSLGAASALFGGLIVGGFMIGAGLAAFGGEETVVAGPGGNGGGGPSAPDPYTVEALDGPFRFTTDRLVAPPNTEVTFTLVNNGQAKHNISFYTSDPAAGGETIHGGAIIDGGGATSAETFTTPGAGEYFFHCDLHPDQMKGTFVVEEGAPPPGGGAAGGGDGAPAGGVTVTADKMKFDTNRIEAKAGEEFTLVFENKDAAVHNISFYTDSSASQLLVPEAEGELIRKDETTTMKFTPPSAGTFFFHCDIHPDMKGEFVVN